MKIIAVALCFVCTLNASAQNAEASASSDMPKVEKTAVGKEVVIAFKNTCEKPVAIFAGAKENIRNPRITTFGGLSSNQKLYLRENEVVCLMTVDNRPASCTVIKPGITSVEVNSSATVITGK